MWPDNTYAEARGSFLTPVEPPTTEPNATPTKSVEINCDWLPYIRGALQQLLLQSTWKTDFVALQLTQDRVFNLIDLFQECSGVEVPIACPFDFTHEATGDPWAPEPRGDLALPTAQFVPTIGWNSTDSHEPGGSDYWQCVTIAVDLGQTVHVDLIRVAYANFVHGDNYAGNFHGNNSGVELHLSGSVVATSYVPADSLAAGSGIYDAIFGSVAADKIVISLLAGVSSSSPAAGNIDIVGCVYTGHAPTEDCP